jgi:hypothetical protein
LTSFLESLGYGPRRKRVLSVEDWAEIRRFTPLGAVVDFGDRAGVGNFAEHGEVGVGLR